jgi:hypothetical protein
VLPSGARVRHTGDPGDHARDEVTIEVSADTDVTALLAQLAPVARVISVTPRRQTLEDVFVKQARGGGQ